MALLEKLLARTPWTRNRNLERISYRSPATVISSCCASNVRGGKVMQPCAITAGRSNHLRRVLCGLVFGSVLLAPYILSAQVSAVVSGTVTDQAGAVVSGATVTGKSVDTRAVRTASTDGSG